MPERLILDPSELADARSLVDHLRYERRDIWRSGDREALSVQDQIIREACQALHDAEAKVGEFFDLQGAVLSRSE